MNNGALHTIGDYCHGRDNNFNLLRAAAAFTVFISHTASIAKLGVVPVLTVLAYVAVNAFFAMSGFLVAKSLYTRNNLKHFLMSRALRMYPALILAVLYTVFVIGLYFSSLPPGDYISDSATHTYLFKNLIQFIWPIPVSLPGLPWKQVNAPLWTLPFELHMYAGLAIFASLSLVYKGRFKSVVMGVYFLIVFVSMGLYVADYANGLGGYGLGHYRYYLRFIAMFGTGVALYQYRDSIPLQSRYFVAILILIALVSPVRVLFVLFAYGLLAYVLLYLAYVPGGILRKYNLVGDYSYGLYIFGYPTQLATAALLPGSNVVVQFLVSFFISMLIAVFSWHYLEKRALGLKRKFSGSPSNEIELRSKLTK